MPARFSGGKGCWLLIACPFNRHFTMCPPFQTRPAIIGKVPVFRDPKGRACGQKIRPLAWVKVSRSLTDQCIRPFITLFFCTSASKVPTERNPFTHLDPAKVGFPFWLLLQTIVGPAIHPRLKRCLSCMLAPFCSLILVKRRFWRADWLI